MDYKNIEFKFNLNQEEIKQLTTKFINDYKNLLDITLTDEEDKKIYKFIDDVIYDELILETLKKLRNKNNIDENEIFNNVENNYLKNERNFIEQFIYDIRFNSEIHIYKDMVIIEKENRLVRFNWLYDYNKKKYNKFKDELDLLVWFRFNELRDKYKKDKDDKYIEIELEQSDIYGDKYKSKLTINFIDNENDFKEIKKIYVDNYN